MSLPCGRVVKLDIDHQATELALVEQLLHSPTESLVDELFWEHHVAGSIVCCPRLWGARGRDKGWSAMPFNQSDERETLHGSYRLFATLRERGIRAHSWV